VEANVVLNSGQRQNMKNPGKDYCQSKATRQAAKLVGVGHDSISKAKRIAREAPDLVQPIERGEMTLNAANKELKTRRER